MKKFTFFIENLISALTSFPRAERAGILWVTTILAGIFAWLVFRPAPPLDADYLAEADRLNDSLRADYLTRTYGPVSPVASDTGGNTAANHQPSAHPTFAAKQPVYIELNGADSAKLCTIRGVGPVISAQIIRYRERLGGFVRKTQLKEVRGITDENFEAISAQFFLDTAVIQKINLNFAPANSLRAHPYFTGSMIDRITKARQMKGGWNTLRELVNNDILLPDEAEKVAPYVVFTAP